MRAAEEEPSAAPRIQTCSRGDRGAQAALYDTCFEKSSGATVLPWRYDANPHGQATSLLAVGAQGESISGYACSPRVVLVRGEEAGVVGQTGDVMTHPEQRKRGVFSDLDREAMRLTGEAGWPFVFGLPNRKSAHIFVQHLGWESVGLIRPWTFVLHPDARARSERLRAGRLAAAAVPWTYWRGTMRRGKLRTLAFENVNVVAIPRFDAEVDDLAREVGAGFPFMVRRDHAYLNWRFIEAPSGRFKAHGVFNVQGRLEGYCVVQLPQSNEPVGHIVDILARDEVSFAGAMEAGLSHLSKAGASVARAHAIVGSWWEKRLRWSGFRAPKKDDAKIVIVHLHDASHALGAIATSPEEWYFTDGDRDDELVS